MVLGAYRPLYFKHRLNSFVGNDAVLKQEFRSGNLATEVCEVCLQMKQPWQQHSMPAYFFLEFRQYLQRNDNPELEGQREPFLQSKARGKLLDSMHTPSNTSIS